MFKTLVLTVSAGLMLFMAAGCGVEGTWVFCEAKPVGAHTYYPFSEVTFNSDTSFHATSRIDGRVIKSAGTYAYNSCKEELTLWIGDKELVYKVRVPGDDRICFMKDLCDGTELSVTLFRQRACPDCATCGPCMAMYRKYRPRLDAEDFRTADAGQAGKPCMPISSCSCTGS